MSLLSSPGTAGSHVDFASPRSAAAAEAMSKSRSVLQQMESIDRTEIDLHRSQVKLVREQSAQFIRDLDSFRRELAEVKMALEKQAAQTDAIDAKMAGWQSRVEMPDNRVSQLNQEAIIAQFTKIDERISNVDQKNAKLFRIVEVLEQRSNDKSEDKLFMSIQHLQEITLKCQSSVEHERSARNAIESQVAQLELEQRAVVSGCKNRIDALHSSLSGWQSTSMQEVEKQIKLLLAQEKIDSSAAVAGCQERIDSLQALVSNFQNVLLQENERRSKDCQERIDAMQKMLTSFQNALYQETERWMLESKRLWSIIDSHTHEVGTEVVVEEDIKKLHGNPVSPMRGASLFAETHPTLSAQCPSSLRYASPTASSSSLLQRVSPLASQKTTGPSPVLMHTSSPSPRLQANTGSALLRMGSSSELFQIGSPAAVSSLGLRPTTPIRPTAVGYESPFKPELQATLSPSSSAPRIRSLSGVRSSTRKD